ncbi:30S ribosomal protein S15 [Enterobacteriaceae endosymbiont of Neohaemonia nigricornis]|uniref:30S ribosomal protein S15 n=1 Tax=Enterobacteriaceae endosymbiont of Neohaemonia nigricornis TaxID=2675792 RepID=UPI0014490776|nr:30S ribosomal protein S15 [Enterobacteriaceae endosymbiont of Neohaemonia nigricornis]QJC30495.1 30S ribosomal protein S15 [Enterobacteriaceae endosymbiont of Neohaemonia nigricornis]
MYFNKQEKNNMILKYQKHNHDNGSTPVQIALLTLKINYLQKHFIIHKKDHHSRRGLLDMISQRRKFLNYFKKKNINDYNKLIESLNLRK